MNWKGHIPEYKITDDMLCAAVDTAAKLGRMRAENSASEGDIRVSVTEMPPYRDKGAGVFAGEHLLCRAPMPQFVPDLMEELEQWLQRTGAHPLIKAGMILYQYIMIQPFEENNICYALEKACIYLEQLKQMPDISEKVMGDGFIRAMEQSDMYGECAPFLLYFMQIVGEMADGLGFDVQTYGGSVKSTLPNEKIGRLLEHMGEESYSTRELMELLGLKHRPTFRDNYLLPAMELGLVEMTIPEMPNSSRQKYRKVNGI